MFRGETQVEINIEEYNFILIELIALSINIFRSSLMEFFLYWQSMKLSRLILLLFVLR